VGVGSGAARLRRALFTPDIQSLLTSFAILITASRMTTKLAKNSIHSNFIVLPFRFASRLMNNKMPPNPTLRNAQLVSAMNRQESQFFSSLTRSNAQLVSDPTEN
jgi:hypothetical protein